MRKHTRFGKEFKRQIRMAIAAAIGFLIAFAWRDYVINLAGGLFTNLALNMPDLSRFLSSLLITLIGVIFIIISSKILE